MLFYFIFYRICEETDQEIYELKRRQRESNIEFNKLSKELMMTKNPLDLKILSDKILELYVSTMCKDIQILYILPI